MIRVEELKEQDKVDNKKMITLCAMCYNTVKRANQIFKTDSDKKKKITDIMYREEIKYSGNVEVVHFLEILRDEGWDKVKGLVKKPLTGLKIAPYYGCLLLRPRGIGIDNTDDPTILENLIETLGAEVLDFSHKQKCCGSYHTVHMKEVVADLSYIIIKQAEEAGANIIITACPLCDYNLGSRQTQIKKQYPNFNSIPVVYFTQLIALAFGLDEKSTSLKTNKPDPTPLLSEIGFSKE
jgi:heterodisulfide reductase subunit B